LSIEPKYSQNNVPWYLNTYFDQFFFAIEIEDGKGVFDHYGEFWVGAIPDWARKQYLHKDRGNKGDIPD
jgi:hypothetical protein